MFISSALPLWTLESNYRLSPACPSPPSIHRSLSAARNTIQSHGMYMSDLTKPSDATIPGWTLPIFIGKRCMFISQSDTFTLSVRTDLYQGPIHLSKISTHLQDLLTFPHFKFDPAAPIVNPMNSALLTVKEVPQYLDNALLRLGLHIEARTSFIT